MKIIVLFIVIFSLNNLLFAQAIKDQPGVKWFDTVRKMNLEKAISEEACLTAKSIPIPKNFIDTLAKYDWIEIANYYYVDKDYSSFNQKNPDQYNIVRIEPNGNVLYFSCSTPFNGGINAKVQISHSNSTVLNPAILNPKIENYTIQTIANTSYLVDLIENEKEYLKIISYQNGLFIYDVTKSGRINAKDVTFRQVHMAVPKMFKWKFDE
jgi:hypothetical protein